MDLEHEKRLTAVEDRAKSNTHRLEEVEKRQDNLDELVSSVAVFAKEQEHIQQDVREIKSDVKALNAKPGKRWDSMIDKALWLVVGAFLAWMLSGMPGVSG